MAAQQDLMKQQDEDLNEISEIAQRLRMQAQTRNQELQDQHILLRKLEGDIDTNYDKLNFVMKKLGKLLKTNGKY